MSRAEWLPIFVRCARHLPGFGGLQTFDRLEFDEIEAIMQDIVADQQRRERQLASLK